jgi:hypothetical protein
MQNLYMTLYDAPPGAVGQVARALLTPEQAAHPMFADLVDMFRGADLAMVREHRAKLARAASRKPAEDRRAGPTGPECAPPAGLGDRHGGPCGLEEAEKICSQKYEQSLNVTENTGWRKGISHDVNENK